MSAGKVVLWVTLPFVVIIASLVVVLRHFYSAAPAQPVLQAARPYTLRVLADQGLGDMQQVLAQAAAQTGVTVKLKTVDTYTAAQDLADGTAQHQGYDAVWFAADGYFGLFPNVGDQLADTTAIMSSPTVLAVQSSVARRLGWENGPVTWKDIWEAAGASKDPFTFGMASPVTADSGLAGLVAPATAVAGVAELTTKTQVVHAAPELTSLFQSQVWSAPNPAMLVQDYLRELRHPGPGTPDGIIGDEADLIALKAEAPPKHPVTLVYPSSGVIESDYSLSLLTSAPAGAGPAFKRLVGYLTSPVAQRQIVATTHRRAAVRLDPADRALPALPDVLHSPGNPGTLQSLIDEYLNSLRAPGRTVYVLDTSSSMTGAGIKSLKAALTALTGAGGASGPAGEFSQFRDGEEVTFLPFRDAPTDIPEKVTTFTIPRGPAERTRASMRAYISKLSAGDHTAIYDALARAYRMLQGQDASGVDHIDSIVLITDGKNTNGDHLHGKKDSFTSYYDALGIDSEPAPVYVIAVVDATLKSLKDLGDVANLTGGTLTGPVSAAPGALAEILADIRGYQ